MYTRLSAVLFPVMSVFLIGAVIWGYQEHQEKNAILIKAENQYQRAFHDLAFHVDKLHEQLGNTLAVNSTSQAYHRKGLVNVWRITSEAQNEINQLPLTLLPFNKTEDFLSHISNFAYRTAVRDLSKEPLSDKEYETMKMLYAKSKEISGDLRKMQTKVLTNNLRWMDVELALASEDSPRDNTIIDGFKTVDKKVSEYPEINWGPSVASIYQKRTISMLSGNMATPDEIRRTAAKFLNIRPEAVQVAENGRGTEYESYSAKVNKSGAQLEMDFTKKGGQLISFMNPRDVSKAKVEIEEAQSNAGRFLKERGYPEMKPINYDRYDNSVSLTYVATQNGVLIYPEKLTVKVALDNGEVVGLQASDFVYEQHTRKLPKPAITRKEAEKVLNPSFKRNGMQMALIDGENGEEVLCYEFTGRINGSTYRIYVNADNGSEEKIEEVS